MEKKTDNIIRDVLMLSTAILLIILGIVLWKQNKTINEYQNIINSIDTITYADTIYLDKVVRDTVPQTITQTIFKCDTLWKVQGDSVVGEPQIITLVKKKSAIH